MKISILSPVWPYRGGIAAFSERLAHQLQMEGHRVKLYTFTLQYPSFLFPGKTQFSVEPAPEDLDIERRLSSVNPLTWLSLGRKIKRETPDLLIIAYWMPFMAPSVGSVARMARRNHHTKVVALCHNLIPHEQRPGDILLTRWFVHSVDAVIALSQSVCDEVHRFVPSMPTAASPHPLYDNFGTPVSREEACRHLNLDVQQRHLLFFGLIRDYKGLDWLLSAYAALLKDPDVSDVPRLVIAGEFYSGEQRYHSQARELGIDDKVIWRTEFVPDSEVCYYFGAADLIVQPYKTATQSGVTQIAYHFGCPMLVTRVGGLPEIVPDGEVGYVVDPNPQAISQGIKRFLNESHDFTKELEAQRKRYSWSVFTAQLLRLFDNLKNIPNK